MCEREINSCLDYLWHDKTASSGYYDIWEKDTLLKSRVYCDMRPDDIEAWTLVMSYDKANAGEFEEWSFYEHFPRNEIDADSGNYRYKELVSFNFNFSLILMDSSTGSKTFSLEVQ